MNLVTRLLKMDPVLCAATRVSLTEDVRFYRLNFVVVLRCINFQVQLID